MDGNGGRGGGGGGGGAPARNAAADNSGKKRRTRSKTAAAQVQAQAAASGANNGVKKSANAQASGGNNKPKVATAATEKKKTAAAQSGNQQQQQQHQRHQQQQQQQSSDQLKKKKKKRRLHAGAVAAKAAAAAAAATAAAASVSSSTSGATAAATRNSDSKPAVDIKPPREGQLIATGKNVQLKARAPPAPGQSSSSATETPMEKPKEASSLKPAKKKQKVSQQQRQQQQQQQVNGQQATQNVPKQKQPQAQASSVPAPGPGSISKPKVKAKRKIEEVNASASGQVVTTTLAPKQNLRQPAADALPPPSSTTGVALVAKKRKMVVLKRKPVQAPSEAPSATVTGGSPPAVAAPVAVPTQDNRAKTISAATNAASTASTATGDSTTSVAASRSKRAMAPAEEHIDELDGAEMKTTTTLETQASPGDSQITKSIQSPRATFVQSVQEANATTQKLPSVEKIKTKTPAEQAKAEAAAAVEILAVPEQPNSVDLSAELTPVSAQMTPVAAATPSPTAAADNASIPIAQPSPSLSPQQNEPEEWMVNTPSPTTELEFAADEAFLQPQPALTSSATDDTNVLALLSPDRAEEPLSPAITESKPIEIDVASPASSSNTQIPSVMTTVKVEPKEKSEALVIFNLPVDDGRQPDAEANSSAVIKAFSTHSNIESSRKDSKEEETKKHEPTAASSLPPPVPVKQTPSKSVTTLQTKQTEASSHAVVPRNPIVESRLRAPSKIEIPSPQPQQEANAWGASFGMAITPDRASASSSSSLQLLTSQTSPALATSPLSSWFLSKGHANFVQQVSFPPRPAQHHRRRSLSPRKQLSANSSSSKSQTAQATQQDQSKPAEDEEDDEDRLGSRGNAFLESLTQRSNWRTWYGNVDKKDLLDPPLKHIPAEVHSAIDNSVGHVSESVVIASSSGAADDQTDDTESIERQRTKTRSIELLEAEIRAEKARARAFDQELLLMLQGGSALPSQM